MSPASTGGGRDCLKEGGFVIASILKRLSGRAGRKKKQKQKAAKAAAKAMYPIWVEQLPVQEDLVILEARNGRTIDGNIWYIARQLLTDDRYAHLRVHIVAENEAAARTIGQKLAGFSDERMKLVLLQTEEYYRDMACAAFLVNDSAIRNFFIKKEGQTYLNVWHGTPLKTMGRRVSHEPHATGSVQKNFIIADFLLYPSDYMMEHMIEDYMISDLSEATILMGGYPRNTAFYDHERREEVRAELGLEGRKVYAYMPTWRPQMMGDDLARTLAEMDSVLQEDEVLLVNVHPLAEESVDLNAFASVRPFSGAYETYEELNAADALITDYSSVFYDFAVTGRKVVLLTEDEEEYTRTRGLYEPLSVLPFDRAEHAPRAIELARQPKTYDDAQFLKKYCAYEGPDAADLLCRRFFLGEHCMEERQMPANGRKNVLVWGGDLDPESSRTRQVLDYLAEAVKGEDNIYLIFNRRDLAEHYEILQQLPGGVRYMGRTGWPMLTADQQKVSDAYEEGRISFEEYWNGVRDAFALERKRNFGDMRIDRLVQIPEGKKPCPESTIEELEFSLY